MSIGIVDLYFVPISLWILRATPDPRRLQNASAAPMRAAEAAEHASANAPNSIPPERVFSIPNDTFDDDQDRALADYIELSLQLHLQARVVSSSVICVTRG